MSLYQNIRKAISYDYDIEKLDDYFIRKNVYNIEHRKSKKSFLFVYNNKYNFEKNLRVLVALIIAYFPVVEIKNCKYGKHVMDAKDYQKCRRHCPYSVFCNRRKEEGFDV